MWLLAFGHGDRMITWEVDIYFSLFPQTTSILPLPPNNTSKQLCLEPPMTHMSTKEVDIFVLISFDPVEQHLPLLTSPSFLKYSFLSFKWHKTHVFLHINCSILFSSKVHPSLAILESLKTYPWVFSSFHSILLVSWHSYPGLSLNSLLMAQKYTSLVQMPPMDNSYYISQRHFKPKMWLGFSKALQGILQLSLETIALNYQFPHLLNGGENSPNDEESMRHFNKVISGKEFSTLQVIRE